MSKRNAMAHAVASLLLLGSSSAALAAGEGPPQPPPTVTAAATPELVRFLAPADVYQIRLEVFGPDGEKVFDSDFAPGNVLDWRLRGQETQRWADGTFVCVVSVRDLSGRLSRRWGVLSRDAEAAHWLAPAQANGTSSELQLLADDEATGLLSPFTHGAGRATALLAHDGRGGLLTSGSGGLSFRLGDFFAGKDVERMRLTEQGNLGIGVRNPRDRLDVAGVIRTSEGIRFADGTLQTTAAMAGGQAEATKGPTPVSAALVDGTGTPNVIAKWTTGMNIGDSTIAEVGGNVGIGTTNPSGVFDLQRASSGDILQRFWNTGSGGAKLRYVAANGATSQVQFVDLDETIAAVAVDQTNGIQFRVTAPGTNSEPTLAASTKMAIGRSGGVGIGTTSPLAKVDIQGGAGFDGAGDPKAMAFQYSGGGYRHWIRTRHNAAVGVGNAIDFFVNNVSSAGGSSGPGTGSTLVMTLDSGRVGIGTTIPTYKLEIIDPSNRGLRVQADTPGGTVASFGNVGVFDIDSPGVAGGRLKVREDGTVIMGGGMASSLIVGGPIHSAAAGFKFPDNSVQTTAAVANDTYTTVSGISSAGVEISCCVETSILHLDLPSGTYMLSATVQLKNTAASFPENNTREIFCRFDGDRDYNFTLPPGGGEVGGYNLSTTMHTVLNVSSGGVDLKCVGSGPNDDSVFVLDRRLTAVKLTGNVFVQ
jgi:hypothetical protein